MKCMSFHMTADAVRAGTKDVTRRRGWKGLRPNDVFDAVERYRGVRVEDRVSLGLHYVVSVRTERLSDIDAEDVKREGLPGAVTREGFIELFCKAMRCRPDALVQRIEFRPLNGKVWP